MSSVARTTEISATSEVSFDDAIRVGLERARQTLRGLKSARITNQEVEIGADGRPSGYRVDMLVRFVLDGYFAGDLPPYPDPAKQTADFFEE
ncbi:MAG: dodecin domain-containing protein [Actinobacteria bacterium]|nr:MAG: dodecin domain-containing protein [Actinomycetota bacterium]